MTKPSVLFINRVYPPQRGASGCVLRDLARGFADDGWRVTILTTGPDRRKESEGDFTVIRLRTRGRKRDLFYFALIWLRLLWAALKVPRHDLVVTMTDPPLLVVAGKHIAQFKKSHHIHWCQDLYPDILPCLGLRIPAGQMRFFTKLSRKAMKSCDKIVAVGRCMAKKLTRGGMDPRRVAVIPNWPDQELLPRQDGDTRKPRKIRKLENASGARPFDELLKDGTDRKFRVLYSGNLGRAHPYETILDAAGMLAADHPEIEFVFVGDGFNFTRLAHERARRGLENVRLLPYQPLSRLREVMESGDVHLISMKQDVSGLIVPCKLYAALTVGRPCVLIGPDDCETAQVINDFKAGSIVPQGDAAGLAAVIKTFRFDSDAWFAAYEGATKAGQVFVPAESIRAWAKRARDVVGAPAAAPHDQYSKAA